VIAHRLSTIRDCDRIICLDKGKIIEEGTYDELIANKGFFSELVSRQLLDAE
jgi:ABC-type multidrug transport system, ATPase and permease components